MKLNIQARLVAAVAQFKASNDIRYYLNGVYAEPIPGGGVLIVATNGHALCIWRDTAGEIERPAILRIGKRLEHACAGADTKRLKIIDDRLVVVDKQEFEIYVQEQNGNKPGNWEVPGDFPKWQRVVPNSQPVPTLFGSLNPAYVALVDRALAIGMGADRSGAITFNQVEKGSSIGVTCSGASDFYSVIMPVRDERAGVFPAWLSALKNLQPDLTAPEVKADLPLPGQQPSDADSVERREEEAVPA